MYCKRFVPWWQSVNFGTIFGTNGSLDFEPREQVASPVQSEASARQQWSNPMEFLLSCIAMSVGLGNVWRFPFTAYQNGGGAFLIPYLLVLLLIGRPLYFMELGKLTTRAGHRRTSSKCLFVSALGQFSSSNSVKVWNMVPAARGEYMCTYKQTDREMISKNIALILETCCWFQELGTDKLWQMLRWCLTTPASSLWPVTTWWHPFQKCYPGLYVIQPQWCSTTTP